MLALVHHRKQLVLEAPDNSCYSSHFVLIVAANHIGLRSTRRYCTASATWLTCVVGAPARSAMVRATFRARCVLRADQPRRAAVCALGGAQVATRARVHGRNHLEPGGEIRPLRGPGDGDMAGLQRLAQGLQGSARELGHFVQKQDSVVRQRYFARPRGRASTHQRYRTGGWWRSPRSSMPPMPSSC